MEVIKEILKHVSCPREYTAIRSEQKSYSPAQIITSALNISKLLLDMDSKTLHKEGLRGQRVGIVAKPSAEFVAGMLGTWLCGGVVVPLALSYPEAELLHVMEDADISMILSSTEHYKLMEHMAAKCSAKISHIPSVSGMIQNDSSHEHSEDEAIAMVGKLMKEIENSLPTEGDDPALILYTSGTTGKPKGVVHTHGSIISQAQILTEAWEYSSSDQILHCVPLHHVHGLFNLLLGPLYAGAVVEFMPKFSVRGIWQRWRESYPTDGSKTDDAISLFSGVPTMYIRLLQGYKSMDPDLQAASASAASKLRLMTSGSSALPYPVLKQWKDVTGHVLLERYGMTEFVVALSNPLHGNRKAGTVGKPLPRVEVKISSENSNEVHSKGVGELCVRSPSLFKEYWKRPEATKESFIEGGFFKTGDTVTMDEDGYYIILGRTNADIIKVGGYKLSALEIESVLLEHEIISECCILGVPDTDYGEAVCAIIVLQEDAKKKSGRGLKPALTLEELRTWSKEKLAPYKIPTKLFLWDSLPRNAMGKVNKMELKRLVESKGLFSRM